MDDPRQSLPGSIHAGGSLGIRDPRLSGPLPSYGTGALFGEVSQRIVLRIPFKPLRRDVGTIRPCAGEILT